MLIRGFQKTTLLDYPGKIACTIFVAGCNFRCPFCQNKDLILPELSENLKTYKEKEILDFLKKRIGKLEAVCITGGEPTIYPDLPEFVKKAKAMGYSVKLDTNGTNPEMVENLIKNRLLDYVALDLKGPFDKYYQYTNISNSQIKNVSYYSSSDPAFGGGVEKDKNMVSSRLRSNNNIIVNNIKKTIEILLNSGIDFELRTTVVSTLHTKDDLIKMVKEMKFMIQDSKFMIHIPWYLQNFRPKNCLNPEFDKIKPYYRKWFDKTLREIKKYFPTVKLRGI